MDVAVGTIDEAGMCNYTNKPVFAGKNAGSAHPEPRWDISEGGEKFRTTIAADRRTNGV